MPTPASSAGVRLPLARCVSPLKYESFDYAIP